MLDLNAFLHVFYSVAAFIFNAFFLIAFTISLIYVVMLFFVLLTRKNEFREKSFNKVKVPKVSIHIPTRNELAALTCAEACLNFDYPQDKFEILIGDDSDQPAVSKQLQNFASQYKDKVHVFQRETNIGYKAGNLNNLISHSTGEIFVIFDSDFIPGVDFLKRIVTPFIDSTVCAVQARWKPKNARQNIISTLSANIVEVFHHVMMPFMQSITGTVVICGSAEAVRKSYLIESGNWQNGSLTEDIEYSFRLIRNNQKIVYLPDLECECEVPFKSKDLYRQQMRWAYGVISALKQHIVPTFLGRIPLFRKLSLIMASIGYLLTLILEILFISGFLKLSGIFIFPAESIFVLLAQTLVYVLLTVGPLLVAVWVLFLTKKSDQSLRLLLSTFSFGLLTIYYVNIGIYKALMNKPMQWFLVTKSGNERVALSSK